MSLDPAATLTEPLTRPEQLLAPFIAAEKRDGVLLVGLEHEKLPYLASTWEPVPYPGPTGIEGLLAGFTRFGFTPFREGEGRSPIAMTRGIETVSLEPGGQVELSGTPFTTAREAHAENLKHLTELKTVADGVGVRLLTLGYRPFGTVAEMPWMPKRRYEVMRQTLGPRGSHAFDMMLMTATGQVSLDWKDEADCVKKTVVAARLAPVLVALYANSPIVRGEDSGFASYRSRVWNDVDPSRAGYLRAWFDGSFSYQAYVDWALDAPLLFIRRGGQYLMPPLTFRALFEHGFEGQPATVDDWKDHLSTLFPEVRLKRVLEIRSADANGAPLTGALAALMRGLLYDQAALDGADALLPRLPFAAHLELHRAAQRHGLDAVIHGTPLKALATEVVELARAGLARLDPLDVPLLEPLRAVAYEGRSPAADVREAFQRYPDKTAFLSRFAL